MCACPLLRCNLSLSPRPSQVSKKWRTELVLCSSDGGQSYPEPTAVLCSSGVLAILDQHSGCLLFALDLTAATGPWRAANGPGDDSDDTTWAPSLCACGPRLVEAGDSTLLAITEYAVRGVLLIRVSLQEGGSCMAQLERVETVGGQLPSPEGVVCLEAAPLTLLVANCEPQRLVICTPFASPTFVRNFDWNTGKGDALWGLAAYRKPDDQGNASYTCLIALHNRRGPAGEGEDNYEAPTAGSTGILAQNDMSFDAARALRVRRELDADGHTDFFTTGIDAEGENGSVPGHPGWTQTSDRFVPVVGDSNERRFNLPGDVCFSADGASCYVATFGSTAADRLSRAVHGFSHEKRGGYGRSVLTPLPGFDPTLQAGLSVWGATVQPRSGHILVTSHHRGEKGGCVAEVHQTSGAVLRRWELPAELLALREADARGLSPNGIVVL